MAKTRSGKSYGSAPKKAARKSPKKKSPVPSTSLVRAAVVDAASPGVARSLMTKGYSTGLGGVGMDTLTKQTKKEVKKMTKGRRVRYGSQGLGVNWSGPGRVSSRNIAAAYKPCPSGKTRNPSTGRCMKPKSAKPCPSGSVRNPSTGRCKKAAKKTTRPRAARTATGINWSGKGVPSTRKIKKASSKAACGSACGPSSRTRRPRVRDPVTCKCMVLDGQAARKAVGCAPRMGKNGKMYETVAVKSASGSIRCIKAGGATAKKALGQKACPAGKTLKTYRTTVPTANGGRRSVNATRCVKAVGEDKDCPANQVLVMANGKGVTKNKRVQRCVLPETAAKKGLQIVRRGTLPIRPKITQVTAQGRPAMSLGR